MKNIKKNIQCFLIINILFLLSGCSQYIFKNQTINQIICKNKKDKKKHKQYKKEYYEKNYYDIFKTLTSDPSLTERNINIYPSPLYHNIFIKIDITNESLNLKNIYFTNNQQLVFNQLSFQTSNEKKIYNFGVGYRNYHCTYLNWNIGNNIFYDTIISNNANNNKILSIGNEFFKKKIHVSINTYYNTTNNNLIHINHKKYLPCAYDIRIIKRLSYLRKIYGKFNIEHYLNNKHCIKNKKNSYIQTINIMNNTYNFKNKYKLIIGISYIPIPICTFDIDKTIYDTVKHHETKFNITVNYNINIPLIYQIKTNDKKINNNIFFSNNEDYQINRNNKILFDYYNNNVIKTQYEQYDQTNLNKKNNNNYNNPTEPTNDINNSEIYFQKDISKTIKNKQINNYITNNSTNIPNPPPIFEFLQKNKKNGIQKENDEKNIENDLNNENNQHTLKNEIEIIQKHKKNKFASLGSEEHLLKLNDLRKQRKKTLSTSSNDNSSNSEPTTLLKIMERQKILKTNNDTDSDDTDSIISSHEFSDN